MNRAFLSSLVHTTILCTAVAGCSNFIQTASSQNAPPSGGPPMNNVPMQEYMKLMMPGERHTIFGRMVGKWSCKLKVWNTAAPSAPPMEFSEESESKLGLGGRFLVEESKGTMMGMPMQRMSVLGYDNYKKIYTLTFYSSMDTATNTASGTFDADGKVLTLRGEFDEPQGKNRFKNVISIQSDDVRVFESYKILADGKEWKALEETYTRVK